jgi:hypothetical protein
MSSGYDDRVDRDADDFDDRDRGRRDDRDDRDERLTRRELADVKARVKTPAVVLLVFAILNLVFVPLGAINFFTLPAMIKQQKEQIDRDPNMQAAQKKQMKEFFDTYEKILMAVLPVSLVLQGVLGVLQLIGSRKMMKLQSRGWAKAAAIISIVPVGQWCCFVTIPVGIWALVVLGKPEVVAGFEQSRPAGDEPTDRY